MPPHFLLHLSLLLLINLFPWENNFFILMWILSYGMMEMDRQNRNLLQSLEKS